MSSCFPVGLLLFSAKIHSINSSKPIIIKLRKVENKNSYKATIDTNKTLDIKFPRSVLSFWHFIVNLPTYNIYSCCSSRGLWDHDNILAFHAYDKKVAWVVFFNSFSGWLPGYNYIIKQLIMMCGCLEQMYQFNYTSCFFTDDHLFIKQYRELSLCLAQC